MTLVIHPNESKKEAQCRLALQNALRPGETLLEYSSGQYRAAAFSPQNYWIGITEQRFIFIRQKKTQKAFSINFAFVQAVNDPPVKKTRITPQLRITLRTGDTVYARPENLIYRTASAWTPYFENMAQIFRQHGEDSVQPPVPISTEMAAQQLKDLEEISAFPAAQAILKWRMAADPHFAANPSVQGLQRQMSNLKLGMVVAAIAFILVLAYFGYLFIRGQAILGFGTILAVIGLVELLRGRLAARSYVLTIALLTSVLNIVLTFLNNQISPLDIIMWVSFGLAMTFLLVGYPTRIRIALGGLIFAVGVPGVLAFAFFGSRFAPDLFTSFLPIPTGPFIDDFSMTKGWKETNVADYASARENGAYSVTIKTGNHAFFSSPPITFYPNHAAVDARVASDLADASGGFYGLSCKQDSGLHNYYDALIDPTNQTYLVVRKQDDTLQRLTSNWEHLSNLKPADQFNRIELVCQDNSITLTVNGSQVVNIPDSQMAQFKDGVMSLVTGDTSDVSSGSFKMLFDNAAFYPPQ